MKVKVTTTVRPTNAYRAIVRAMREERPMFVSYTRANGSHTDRWIEPYAVTRNARGDRYARVMDRTSGETRTFRVDRIGAYALGPAFAFRVINPSEIVLSPEDDQAYREWADETQRQFVDHASVHPELMAV